MLVIHGGQHDGAEAIGQLQSNFIAGNSPQGISKIPYIKADFQLLAVAGNRALVFCRADGVIGTHTNHLIGEHAADRALVLFRNDQTNAINGGCQVGHISHQLDGAVGGDDPLPIQEVTLQQTADQSCAADLEQDVLGADGERGITLSIGQNLFHFLQALGRNNEGQGPVHGIFGMESPAGQTETVNSNGRNHAFIYFKPDASVNGPALVIGNRENGAGNQILQRALGNIDAAAVAHIGQFRIIIGRLGGNGERRVTGPDGDLKIVIHHHGYRAFRHTADNITEELCRQYAGAGIGNLAVDKISNSGLHIIAGEAQTGTGFAKNTLDHRQAALLSNGTAGNIQALEKLTFFTGETHTLRSFSLI